MLRSIVVAVLVLIGCTTYRDLLDRGHRLYQENQFERALANWRALESDMEMLRFEDQTRYAYLRGMTDLKLGYNADARHWLAIAKAINTEHPGGLSEKWAKETDANLAALSQSVYVNTAAVAPPTAHD